MYREALLVHLSRIIFFLSPSFTRYCVQYIHLVNTSLTAILIAKPHIRFRSSGSPIWVSLMDWYGRLRTSTRTASHQPSLLFLNSMSLRRDSISLVSAETSEGSPQSQDPYSRSAQVVSASSNSPIPATVSCFEFSMFISASEGRARCSRRRDRQR